MPSSAITSRGPGPAEEAPSWASPLLCSPWVPGRWPPAHMVTPRAHTQNLLYNLKNWMVWVPPQCSLSHSGPGPGHQPQLQPGARQPVINPAGQTPLPQGVWWLGCLWAWLCLARVHWRQKEAVQALLWAKVQQPSCSSDWGLPGRSGPGPSWGVGAFAGPGSSPHWPPGSLWPLCPSAWLLPGPGLDICSERPSWATRTPSHTALAFSMPAALTAGRCCLRAFPPLWLPLRDFPCPPPCLQLP